LSFLNSILNFYISHASTSTTLFCFTLYALRIKLNTSPFRGECLKNLPVTIL
jgi:hypothetical protein